LVAIRLDPVQICSAERPSALPQLQFLATERRTGAAAKPREPEREKLAAALLRGGPDIAELGCKERLTLVLHGFPSNADRQTAWLAFPRFTLARPPRRRCDAHHKKAVFSAFTEAELRRPRWGASPLDANTG
jgi:hypothetical protein